MVHKRSEKSFMRRLVSAKAQRDRELAETICMEDNAKIVDKYFGFKGVLVAAVNKGDVLRDSRARGVLQKVPLPQKPRIQFMRR